MPRTKRNCPAGEVFHVLNRGVRSVQSGVNTGIFGLLSIKMIGVQADFVCGPAGFTPADQGLATNHAKPDEAAPHPTSRRWKPGLATRNRKTFVSVQQHHLAIQPAWPAPPFRFF